MVATPDLEEIFAQYNLDEAMGARMSKYMEGLHMFWDNFKKRRSLFLKHAFPFYGDDKLYKGFLAHHEHGNKTWRDLIEWAKNLWEVRFGRDDPHAFRPAWLSSFDLVGSSERFTKFAEDMSDRRHELCHQIREMLAPLSYWIERLPGEHLRIESWTCPGLVRSGSWTRYCWEPLEPMFMYS